MVNGYTIWILIIIGIKITIKKLLIKNIIFINIFNIFIIYILNIMYYY